MDALGALPPSKQRDALHAYSRMKEGVMGFLDKFTQQGGRVVTKDDVKTYFANLDGQVRPPPDDAGAGPGAGPSDHHDGGDGAGEDGRRVRRRE